MALDKKLVQVRAEHEKQVEDVRVRDGPEAAKRYENKIAADEVELNNVLMQVAREWLNKEQGSKEDAIFDRANAIQKEETDKVAEQKKNKGLPAFAGPEDQLKAKNDVAR